MRREAGRSENQRQEPGGRLEGKENEGIKTPAATGSDAADFLSDSEGVHNLLGGV